MNERQLFLVELETLQRDAMEFEFVLSAKLAQSGPISLPCDEMTVRALVWPSFGRFVGLLNVHLSSYRDISSSGSSQIVTLS